MASLDICTSNATFVVQAGALPDQLRQLLFTCCKMLNVTVVCKDYRQRLSVPENAAS